MSDKVALMFQHAEIYNTTMTISDTGSITEVIQVFELYGNAPGPKIITQKSEIMCIGLGCLKEKLETFLIFPKQISWKYLVYF